ncbi:MAG: chorismate lyase [Aquabacterium sp.]|jgi:chorismate--pyruvate lyase|nr:chorismate lyase [Aquabacterium sp.]
MLHRLPSSALPPLSRRDARHGGQGRVPVQTSTRQWLSAPGSLTARLRQHGTVKVQVLRQGHQALWPQEQQAIGTRCGHVREVILTIDGRPAVWARSVTSARGLKGPWRALKGLGARPLAELLFEHRGVKRDPLQGARLASHSPAHGHLKREWLALAHAQPGTRADAPPAPAWSRRSVFWHKGQALQVMECFAPWVLPLSARQARA